MVALIQRVTSANVRVEQEIVGTIGKGMLILLGIHRTDTVKELKWLVKKCTMLRIYPDEAGRMNRSILEAGGDALVVSQFTLYGDASKGNRPSYIESAPPEVAEPLYERFVDELGTALQRPIATGIFGALMDVELVNDGPVTLWLERKADPIE